MTNCIQCNKKFPQWQLCNFDECSFCKYGNIKPVSKRDVAILYDEIFGNDIEQVRKEMEDIKKENNVRWEMKKCLYCGKTPCACE